MAIAHLLARVIFAVLSNQKVFTLSSLRTYTVQGGCVKRIEQNVTQINQLTNNSVDVMLVNRGTGEVIG